MPTSYIDIDRDEMEYIDGGITTAQKIGIGVAIVAVSAAVGTAIAMGQFWVAARAMGYALKTYCRKLGAKTVAKTISWYTGWSFGSIWAVVKLL